MEVSLRLHSSLLDWGHLIFGASIIVEYQAVGAGLYIPLFVLSSTALVLPDLATSRIVGTKPRAHGVMLPQQIFSSHYQGQ